MKERSHLEDSINQCLEVKKNLDEITELIELYENDKNKSDELEKEILSSLEELSDKANILSGKRSTYRSSFFSGLNFICS